MRTTLTIDDDLLEAAKSLAAQKKIPLGKAVSELMRKGMQRANAVQAGKGGFPVFNPPKNSRILTIESVKKAEEEDDISS
jgi:hypothetical protein